MNKIIIEKVETCNLVKEGSEPNSEYIIHDGKNVLETGFIDHLNQKFRKFLDEKLDEKLKEERRKTYLELKNEFEK